MQKRIIYHLLFWTVYLLFKTYLNFISSSLPDPALSSTETFFRMLLAQASLLLVKIPMVYILFGIAQQYLNKKITTIRAFFSVGVLFAGSTIIFLLINHYIILEKIYKIPQSSLLTGLSFTSILYSFFLLCFIAGIALAIKLVRINIRQKVASQEMMKTKLETELQFLKAQTNPHFLFNTLNNIYALARKKSDDTADVVMKLSKLLRFMLYESQHLHIPLNKELTMIGDYIKLEELRYNDNFKVSYDHSIDDPAQPIAPLILLPFLENAFKHGASETRFNSFINIQVSLKEGQLLYIIENSKTETQEGAVTKKIGLTNISRQLELMYPEHSLEIEKQTDRFKVTLKINLLAHATV